MQFSLCFYIVGLVLVCSSQAFADRYAGFKVELQGDSIEFELRVYGSVGREFTWWIVEIEDSSSEFMQVIIYRKPQNSLDKQDSNQDFISKWSGELGGSYGNIFLSKGIEYKAHLFMGNSYSDEDHKTSASVLRSFLRFSLENSYINFEDVQISDIRFLQDPSLGDTSSNDSANSSDTSDSTDTTGTSDSTDTTGTSDSTDTPGTADSTGTTGNSDSTDTTGNSDSTDTTGNSDSTDNSDTSDDSDSTDSSDPIPNQSGSSGSYKPDPNEDLTSAYSQNSFLRWVPGGQDLKGDSGLQLTIVNIIVLVVILIH